MSTLGTNVKSRRKKGSPSDRQLSIDFDSKIQFIHEMSGGETEFDLTNLTLPAGSGSFSNPNPETVRSLNLLSLRKRIKLFNGEGRSLPVGFEWEVVGTKIVFKNITADPGEVFFGEIENAPRQAINFLDGRQNQATGFLTPGETEFNLGFTVSVTDINTSEDRLGPVEVFRQRQIQYLNSSVTSEGSADGDYYFVDDGSGFSSLIKFNDPGTTLDNGLPEFVSVKNNMISVDREDGSIRREVEALGGAVDRIAEEVSIIQSIPKSTLLAFNATRQQLKQFGDKVLDALSRIKVLEGVATEKNKFQIKNLQSNTSSTGILSDLTFNNLIPGKKYEINFRPDITNDDIGVRCDNGNKLIFNALIQSSGRDNEVSLVETFIASDSQLVFEITEASGTLKGGGGRFQTHAILTELNDTQQTSDFT